MSKTTGERMIDSRENDEFIAIIHVELFMENILTVGRHSPEMSIE